MPPTPATPLNIKGRLSRVYLRENSFIDDKGKNVEYTRLVLEPLVKGEIFEIEIKLEKQDLRILKVADDLELKKG